MKIYGLIGMPLSHSFSKKYFQEKFENEGILDTKYELFEIPEVSDVYLLLKDNPDIRGLNVTIPYKKTVIPFLDFLDGSAEKVGAVNVIKINEEAQTIGYNTDYYAFLLSLKNFLSISTNKVEKALVLGSGGASAAVVEALKTLKIPYLKVSRTVSSEKITYDELSDIDLSEFQLIVNTTPLGMYPEINSMPPVPYEHIGPGHFLFDVIYNPEETMFLKLGKKHGAKVKNGLEMLHLQAEKLGRYGTRGDCKCHS